MFNKKYKELKNDFNLLLRIIDETDRNQDTKRNNELTRITEEFKAELKRLYELNDTLTKTIEAQVDTYQADMKNCSDVVNAMIGALNLEFSQKDVEDPSINIVKPTIKVLDCKKNVQRPTSKRGNKRNKGVDKPKK